MKKFIILTLLVFAVCAVVVVVLITSKQKESDTVTFSDSANTVSFEVDHKTYRRVAELRKESDVVVLGSVLDDGSTRQDRPVGMSGDGQPAPGLVSTDFSVRVDEVLKGDVEKAATIAVTLTGGTIDDTRYASEGMPWLSKGDTAIIYLSAGDDGKYYPMAGGAAIALEKDDGSGDFVLPGEVSGRRETKVSETKF